MLKDLLVVLIAIGVLLLSIGVIAIIKRKQGLSLFEDEKDQRSKARVATNTRSSYSGADDYEKRQQRAALRLINAAGTPDPVLGFCNSRKWRVRGKKKSTGRVNTLEVRAFDEAQARALGVTMRDMVEPIIVEALPPQKTEYLDDYDLTLPVNTEKDDSWALSLSVGEWDVTPMSREFFEFLTSRRIPISRLAGRNKAAETYLSTCSRKDRATIYAYVVDCNLSGTTPCDVNTSPRLPVYMAFADAAAKDPKVMKSVVNRPGGDFWSPNKSTNVYRYAYMYLMSHQ